jgi:hypothetical protein
MRREHEYPGVKAGCGNPSEAKFADILSTHGERVLTPRDEVGLEGQPSGEAKRKDRYENVGSAFDETQFAG